MSFHVATDWHRGYLKFYRKPPSHPFKTAETSIWRHSTEFRIVITPGEDARLDAKIEFRNPTSVEIPREGDGVWDGWVLYNADDDEAIQVNRVFLLPQHDVVELNQP